MHAPDEVFVWDRSGFLIFFVVVQIGGLHPWPTACVGSWVAPGITTQDWTTCPTCGLLEGFPIPTAVVFVETTLDGPPTGEIKRGGVTREGGVASPRKGVTSCPGRSGRSRPQPWHSRSVSLLLPRRRIRRMGTPATLEPTRTNARTAGTTVRRSVHDDAGLGRTDVGETSAGRRGLRDFRPGASSLDSRGQGGAGGRVRVAGRDGAEVALYPPSAARRFSTPVTGHLLASGLSYVSAEPLRAQLVRRGAMVEIQEQSPASSTSRSQDAGGTPPVPTPPI
jgi:hypothetical protein